MESMKPFTGRCARTIDGRPYEAEVTTLAAPCDGETIVTVAAGAATALQEAFGVDAEHYRQGICASVAVQIAWANGAGEMPAVGRTRFRAEVIGIRPPRGAGRQLSEFLLMVASMNAIAAFLQAWEQDQQACVADATNRDAASSDHA